MTFTAFPARADAPKPKVAPSSPEIVAPTALQQLRVAGNARIDPDGATRKQIVKDQKRQVAASHKYCIDEAGHVTSAQVISPSGYPAWDEAITKAMLTTWRFRPFTVSGKPVPACTAVTHTFENPSAPPPTKPRNWHRRVD